MKRIRAHLTYANATATLALLFALSGGAIAATGGFSSGGKLQACVNEEGTLKLLKAGKHCRRGQKTVAWGIAGTAGPNGATGAAGAKGTAGAAGGQGAQGPAGAPNPSATSVNGQSITRIFATVAPAAPAVQVLSTQGLTLQFSCPTSADTLVAATGLAGGTDNLVWQGNNNTAAFQGRTERLALTPSTIGSGNYGSGVAQFGTADGHVVTVTYGFDDASNGISSNCAIWGHATSG